MHGTTLSDVLDALVGGGRLRAVDIASAAGIVVDDVTHDSAQAGPGVLFACRPGDRVDGHDFAAAATAAGSPALLVERPLDLEVPQLETASVANSLGPVAARIHGRPSEGLLLIGVTGTSGKTTTAYLLESALRAAGHVTGLIGTVQTLLAGQAVPGVRTTPEASDLQRLLRRMREAGVTAAAMEVSSHGLALGRVAGTRYRVGVFTNLGHDHLDFHAHEEDYYAAKAKLFRPDLSNRAVINTDDSHGRRLAAAVRDAGEIGLVTVSAAGREADVTATAVEVRATGATFTARVGRRAVAVRTALPGAFNVANALAALAAADAAGVDLDAAVQGVADLAGVPGRMERVDAGQPFTVLVDYAHKPEALEHVLAAARVLTPGSGGRRVIVVVGCGGDRDAGKRPLMGGAAAALADLAILTSDNPRTEDPNAILAEMAEGAGEVTGADWTVEPDRRSAIALAVAAAGPGDIVVIAGKGHETYQELAGRSVPFDDRAVVRELLAASG